ncbi:MAG TPA: MFS transporter [Thermoanaerobaculia bacterium]|nr:MFS transporter [Thermoanaerobaculia bacterium]
MSAAARGISGMKAFTTIWIGQLISLLGSGLTGFAMSIWVLDKSHSVTQFTLTIVLTSTGMLVAPFAGAIVDRHSRKTTLILCNIGSALCSLALFLLLKEGALQVWHVYIVVAANSILNTFQWPATVAAITMLVPRDQFGRADGMLEMGGAATTIAAPPLAGLLIVLTGGVWNLLLIDFVTFFFAIVSLLLVTIPNPPKSAEGQTGKRSLWKEAAIGWHFIRERQGLMALLLFFAAINFFSCICGVALLPMVKGFAHSPAQVGLVMSMVGIGMLIGGSLMAATGGPKPRIYGVLGVAALMSVCFLLTGARPSLFLVSAGVLLFYIGLPIMNGSSQAIWQAKVPPDLQGRVFAVRRMIAQFTTPIGDFSSGPLADKVFNPLLVPGGTLAGSIGLLIGVGENRGIGLMFIVGAIFPLLIAIVGFMNPKIRYVERDLPDAVPATPPAGEPETPSEAAAGEAPAQA